MFRRAGGGGGRKRLNLHVSLVSCLRHYRDSRRPATPRSSLASFEADRRAWHELIPMPAMPIPKSRNVGFRGFRPQAPTVGGVANDHIKVPSSRLMKKDFEGDRHANSILPRRSLRKIDLARHEKRTSVCAFGAGKVVVSAFFNSLLVLLCHKRLEGGHWCSSGVHAVVRGRTATLRRSEPYG